MHLSAVLFINLCLILKQTIVTVEFLNAVDTEAIPVMTVLIFSGLCVK